MQDIKELNIPNVCFSLTNELDKNDKRQETFKQQRLERGFDDKGNLRLIDAYVDRNGGILRRK